MQEGARQEDEAHRALGQIGHALLHYSDGHFVPRRRGIRLVPFTVLRCVRFATRGGLLLRLVVVLARAAHNEERLRVDWRLRDQTVGRGQTQ